MQVEISHFEQWLRCSWQTPEICSSNPNIDELIGLSVNCLVEKTSTKQKEAVIFPV